jgi:hypothetical protein
MKVIIFMINNPTLKMHNQRENQCRNSYKNITIVHIGKFRNRLEIEKLLSNKKN